VTYAHRAKVEQKEGLDTEDLDIKVLQIEEITE
jgi:hypothetical protein